MPSAPRTAIAAKRSPCSQSSERTALGPASLGIAESARTAPPTGSVAPPENETTPL
jgi:hypothetical protein